MKLSLDELQVDSYAVQVSEAELAEVKGGLAFIPALEAAALLVGLVIGVITIVDRFTGSSSGSTPNSISPSVMESLRDIVRDLDPGSELTFDSVTNSGVYNFRVVTGK